MNNTGRFMILLSTDRHVEDQRRADEWRRMHARPDALPLPAVEAPPRRSFVLLRRWLPRHA
jgi:hypothetical protein